MSLIQKYAVAIGLFLTMIFGGLPTVTQAPTTEHWVVFALLIVQGVGIYFVPLTGTKWGGEFKTAVAVVLGAGAVVVPYLAPGHTFVWATDGPLLGVALINAIATALGVVLRTDTSVATPVVPVTASSASPDLAAQILKNDSQH